MWDGLRSWERSTVEYVAGIGDAVRGFWDVGAHTGVYALLVAAVNPAARIRAFEPNPAVTPMLLGNLAANGLPHDILVPAALSDVTGVAHLEVPGDVTAAHVAADGIAIRTVRGDDVDDGSPVDLVKIDVEDHELAVLRGMTGLLRRCRPRSSSRSPTMSAWPPSARFSSRSGYSDCSYFTGRGLVPADAHLKREAGHPNFLFLAGDAPAVDAQRRLDSAAPALPRQLPSEEGQEARVAQEVAAPEPPRLCGEPVDPLQPEVAHPAGRVAGPAGEHVEGGAHAEHDAVEPVGVRGHPALLLGAADADEQQLYAGAPDVHGDRDVLLRREGAEGRAPGVGDGKPGRRRPRESRRRRRGSAACRRTAPP